MAIYENQVGFRPAVSMLVSNDDKGDFSNRANWMGARLGTGLKSLAQDVVVIAGTVAGAKALNAGKFAKVTDTLAKGVDTCTKFLAGKLGQKTPKGILEKIMKASSKTKAIGVLAALGFGALDIVCHRTNYKLGRIDQKYTDKAKIKEHQSKILD